MVLAGKSELRGSERPGVTALHVSVKKLRSSSIGGFLFMA
jgi:hypothetical protein